MLETTTTVTIAQTPSDAFTRFTDEMDAWWPSDYSWSQDELVEIGIEPGVDGMCYEIGPHGFRCDFGRVLSWEPGSRLVFTWQISPKREPVPNPDNASEVEVVFREAEDGQTEVELTHRHFERHGDGGEEYRDAMASEYGWPLILQRYVQA
jgi:uncharacterized protein YndB with AHSA1/START domain